jgi:hypothetical protein
VSSVHVAEKWAAHAADAPLDQPVWHQLGDGVATLYLVMLGTAPSGVQSMSMSKVSPT